MLTSITHGKTLSSHKSIYTVFHSQRISSVNTISHITPGQVTYNNMFVLNSKPGHLQGLQLLALTIAHNIFITQHFIVLVNRNDQ